MPENHQLNSFAYFNFNKTSKIGLQRNRLKTSLTTASLALRMAKYLGFALM